MLKERISLILGFSLICLVLIAFPLVADERLFEVSSLNPDRSFGPWLEQENEYFRFVYKKADEKALEEYLAISQDAFEIVTGFFKLLPPEKPLVILYGTQDSPPFGGVTITFPLRIGQQMVSAQVISPKSLLIHEFSHYMHNLSGKSGLIFALSGLFGADFPGQYSILFSDLSIEGCTSFLEGYRSSEYASLPIRAAVLEGQMWNYDQVSNAGMGFPGALRVYFSGMLLQDWVYDHCGDEGFLKIQEQKNQSFLPLESMAFQAYTGLDLETAWGDIRKELSAKYAFARDLPLGRIRTPRNAYSEPQWGRLVRTNKGLLHFRSSLTQSPCLGFWRPNEFPGSDVSGVLTENPSIFIPIEGLIANEFSVNADADRIVFIKNTPESSPLWHSENHNQLYLADIEWSEGEDRALARNIQKLPGTGFFDCLLSPDGKRLFVTQRISYNYVVYEYDLESLSLRPLAIPDGISVTELAVSSDGRFLALDCMKSGQGDVALYDLDKNQFSLITHDEAYDFASGFLSDGRFVFSSDRENTVAVYSFDQGVFIRECVDQIAAFFPVENQKGGYLYASYSAFGVVVRELESDQIHRETVPDFKDLRPSWLARRDELWTHYQEKGSQLSGAINKKNDIKEPSDSRVFMDIAMPLMWSPLFSMGPQGNAYGAGVYGYSSLQENSYYIGMLYNPEAKQLLADLSLSLVFPFMTTTLSYNQRYYALDLAEELRFYHQQKKYSLNLDYPLFVWNKADSSVFQLSLLGAVQLYETVRELNHFSVVESLQLAPERNLLVTSGLFGRNHWLAPQNAFLGGTAIGSGILGLVEWYDVSLPPTFGAVVNFQAGLLVGIDLINLEIKGAWRELGEASQLIPRTLPRWNFSDTAEFYGELSLEWAKTWLGKEYTLLAFLKEQEAVIIGAKSFWQFQPLKGLSWFPELEFFLDFMALFKLYYNSGSLRLGIGYCHDFSIKNFQFESENFCFRFSFGNISGAL
ncbi:MAG: hypothetical protein JXR70_16470 [Spirochaetales bacterium]|nr:hypothetical protein [Spirochaetales bacterium]